MVSWENGFHLLWPTYTELKFSLCIFPSLWLHITHMLTGWKVTIMGSSSLIKLARPHFTNMLSGQLMLPQHLERKSAENSKGKICGALTWVSNQMDLNYFNWYF